MLKYAIFISLVVVGSSKNYEKSKNEDIEGKDQIKKLDYNITRGSKEEMIILGMKFVREAQKAVENQIAERFNLAIYDPFSLGIFKSSILKTIELFLNSDVKSTRKITLASVETSLKPFVILLTRKTENVNELLNSTFQTIREKFLKGEKISLNFKDFYKNIENFWSNRLSNLNKTIDSLKMFESDQFLNLINKINFELKDFYFNNEKLREKCNLAIFNFTKNILNLNKINEIINENFSKGKEIIKNEKIKFLDKFKNYIDLIKMRESFYVENFFSSKTFRGDFDVVKFSDFVRSLNVGNRSMFRRYLMNYDRSYSVAKNAFEFLNELKLGSLFTLFENVQSGLNNLIDVNIGSLGKNLSEIFTSVYVGI